MPHYKDLNNSLHFLDSTEFEHMLPAGCVQITDEETDVIRADAKQKLIDAMTYIEHRRVAYPSYADQFDTIFHEGLDTWYAQILDVKTRYPKE